MRRARLVIVGAPRLARDRALFAMSIGASEHQAVPSQEGNAAASDAIDASLKDSLPERDDRRPSHDYLQWARRMSALFLVAGGVHVAAVSLTVGRGEYDLRNALILAGVAIAAGLAVPALPWRSASSHWLTAASVTGIAMIAVAVIVTGGFESPFAPMMAFLIAVQGAYHTSSRRSAGGRTTAVLTLLSLGVLGGIYFVDAGSGSLLRISIELPIYAAIAFATRARFQYLARESEERRVVAAIGRAVASSLEAERVYELIADELDELTPYDRLVIFTDLPDGGEEMVFERDSSSVAAETASGALPQLQSGVSVPLGPRGMPTGRIMLFSLGEDAFSLRAVELPERVAAQVSPAVANANLHAEAVTEAVRQAERAQLERENEELQQARSELERANEELRWQNSLVRESRERMLQAHETAKRAVAEELHGPVQTKLYAAWVKLATLTERLESEGSDVAEESGRLTDELDRIREHDIRMLSHRLHPSVIRLGLGAGLRSLRDYYEHLLPITLEISEEAAGFEPAGESAIPEAVSLGLYRIAELALGNVIKHAEAMQCVITLGFDHESKELALSVTDDGKGFPPNARAPEGLGLVTINDYADAMSGAFKVTSFPDEGTRLEVRVPFELTPAEQRADTALGMVVNMHWASPSASEEKVA